MEKLTKLELDSFPEDFIFKMSALQKVFFSLIQLYMKRIELFPFFMKKSSSFFFTGKLFVYFQVFTLLIDMSDNFCDMLLLIIYYILGLSNKKRHNPKISSLVKICNFDPIRLII